MMSHLSTAFELLGRCGDWNPYSQKGNPVSSFDVESHRISYRTSILKRGYQESSAIPMVATLWLQLFFFSRAICNLDGHVPRLLLLTPHHYGTCILSKHLCARMQDEKTHRLLIDALDTQTASCNNPIQRLTLLATSLACCYLWESDQRGKDVGRLEISDFMRTSPSGLPM